MLKFITKPYFYIPAIIGVIILIIVAKNKWGWFGGNENKRLSERKIELPNTKTIIKNSQSNSLPERRTATASNVVMPMDECQKISDDTKVLSEQLKNYYDGLNSGEIPYSAQTIQYAFTLREAHYNAWLKCVLSTQTGGSCIGKTMGCIGF